MQNVVVLPILIGLAALLYSSVGHAGASGYLAAMALVGLAPDTMRPSALVLNVLVATIATIQFTRAGFFSWPRFWPFAVGSVPFALVGGAVSLPGTWYRVFVGGVLIYAAYRLWRTAKAPARSTAPTVPVVPALLWGALIGLLSGLTGTGGGIFLGPLLLFTGWSGTRESAGVSAAFNLVNSLAGLSCLFTGAVALSPWIALWAVAAVVGGFVGATLGARRAGDVVLRRVLAIVLLIAGVKMMIG